MLAVLNMISYFLYVLSVQLENFLIFPNICLGFFSWSSFWLCIPDFVVFFITKVVNNWLRQQKYLQSTENTFCQRGNKIFTSKPYFNGRWYFRKNGLTLNIDILRLFPEKSWCQVRCNHCRCSVKKGVLRNFVKFTGKHLCQSLFFNKVAGLPATLLKKRLWHSCFLENFTKFLRTPFLREYLRTTASD